VQDMVSQSQSVPHGKVQALARICRENRVGLCYLFGSQAESGNRILLGETVSVDDKLTDIDVGVVLLDFEKLRQTGQTHKTYSQLHAAMAELFSPYELDLVLLQENHSVFQLEAIKGICVYQVSDLFRDDYEEMILRRSADFKYVLEAYLQERTADLERS